MSDMKLVIAGAAGRMGRQLVAAVHRQSTMAVVGGLEHGGSDLLGADAGELAGIGPIGVTITDDAASALSTADAVIDFTTPASSVALAGACANLAVAHIIGTTGCSGDDDQAIAAAAEQTVIVKSGNMSMGVNLLADLVRRAANILPDDEFDIEVLEMHHRHKVDAPSGTALLLGRAAAQGRDIDLDSNSVRSRDGPTGPRPEGTVGFATLRGGSVVGDHTVMFAGAGEVIELSHRALDRSVFCAGAIAAAKWAHDRHPGLYSMADVLGISGHEQ